MRFESIDLPHRSFVEGKVIVVVGVHDGGMAVDRDVERMVKE